MRLFIQIRNGQPFEHPILQDNLRQSFPNVDINNLPSGFANFIRVEKPVISAYEVYENVSYEFVNGAVTDVHHVRVMTVEEKKLKQDGVKEIWATQGYPSWVFDEVTCSFKPPVAMPTDDKKYQWDESTTSWIEV